MRVESSLLTQVFQIISHMGMLIQYPILSKTIHEKDTQHCWNESTIYNA